jgi:4-hydroxybenzoate polyprenyltransferase
MIHDLYSSLTAREQRAVRWSGAATAAALWLSTAWADPWFLVTVPMIAGGFWVYHLKLRNREDDPEDDLDLL